MRSWVILPQQNLRPLEGKVHNINRDELPPFRVAASLANNFSGLVTNIISQIEQPKLLKAGGMTPLDLPSIDGITKEHIGQLRQWLLTPSNLKAAARTRYNKLTVYKGNFEWLDGQSYNFNTGRTPETKACLFILNEMYQIACLGLIEDGIILNQIQLNTVFQNVDSFDTFVSSLTLRQESDIVLSRTQRYERYINCLIIRNMLNVFDTMMSEKYQRIADDIQTILNKLESRLHVVALKEQWTYSITKHWVDWYSCIVHLDLKAFRSIGLKKWSNRKFWNADAMEDLSRVRSSSVAEDQDNITRALDDIAKHIFSGDVTLWEKGMFLNHELITDRKKLNKKPLSTKKATAHTLRQADITGIIDFNGRATERIEWQFQYEGEMESWLNHPDLYKLRKVLTASARKFWSIDIKIILFYIWKLPLENIKMSKQEILESLVMPSLDTPIQKKPLKTKNTQQPGTIEDLWRGPVGFLLPLRTKSGWVRFITQDSFSDDFFEVYPKMYTPAPFVDGSMKYIQGMTAQIDELEQEVVIQDYMSRIQRYSWMRNNLIEKYIRFI